METMMNINMCRCCASEGTFKDVHSTYHWMGEEEVYVDMLRDCFDISLSSSVEGGDGGICEVCITQLRNAANFKKQVLLTEEQFKSRLQNREIFFKHDIVKVEVSPEHEEDSENDNHDLSEDYSGTDYDIPIKKEAEEKPKKRTVTTRASTSRSKKIKTDDDEADEPETSKRLHHVTEKSDLTTVKSAPLLERSETVRSSPNKSRSKSDKSRLRLTENMNVIKIQPRTQLVTTLMKHHANIHLILNNSNATPIRKHNDKGYACCLCEDFFIHPAELKKHCEDNHDDYTNYLKRTSLDNLLIKLDVTNLTCKLCHEYVDTYEKLVDHLTRIHEKIFYTDIKNQILPFKFDTDILICCNCLNILPTFKSLLEHTNKHYRNFVCDVCDEGFVNKITLTSHSRIHATGTFACDECDKIFNTAKKRNSHKNTVHGGYLSRCSHCKEVFKYYRHKIKHLSEVHGINPTKLICQACGKKFDTSHGLRDHTRKTHLMERPYQCAECPMNFYRHTQLKIHMIKHSGVKKFQCPVCLKSYGRKDNLKSHLRIHENDRRFKCEHCKQAFVQKCSWRSHMRSKHGEDV